MKLQRIVPAVCCLLLLTAAGLNAAVQDDQQINAWITTVKDRTSDPEKRVAAIDELGKAGPKAAAAVPALVEALGDPDAMVRSASAFSLGFIRADAAAVVPALTKALGDSDKFVRSAAASGLEMFGPQARAAAPELTKALDDAYYATRSAAARALGRIGPDARPAFAKLVGLIGDSDKFVRAAAVMAIGNVGAEADQTVPALVRALNDGYVEVRKGAALALGRFPTPASREALKKMAADDPDASARQFAQQALSRMPGVTVTPPVQPSPAQPTAPFAEVRRTWTTPLDTRGFTYHGDIEVGAAAGEKLSISCWFYYDAAPDYPAVKQQNGRSFTYEVQTFTATPGDPKAHYADLKFDILAEVFRRYAALEPGSHPVRVFWSVYHDGKKAYLTGADAWRLGAVFIVEKAADGTVRVTPPSGTEQTTPTPPVRPPSQEVRPVKELRYQTFRDPKEGAFTAQVPAGWRVQGGTTRPLLMFTTFEVQAASPDGQITVFLRMNDVTKIVPTPELAMIGFPEGSWLPTRGTEKMHVLRYLPGAKFVTRLVLPARRLGEQEVKEEDWPALARSLERFPEFEKVNAGAVTYQFERGGRRYRGGALAITKIYPFPGGNMALWHCDTLATFEAPEARQDEAQAAAVRLVGTWRVNPTWLNGVSAAIRKGVAIQSEAAAYTAQLISTAYYQKGKVESRVFQNYSNATLGVVQLMDPRTGQEYTMDNHHTYYFIRANGERYGSEDQEPRDRLGDVPLIILGGK